MTLQNASTCALTVGSVHHRAIVARDFDTPLRFWSGYDVRTATVVDPDGVVVELIGIPSR
jgi:hypothetical protein